MHSLEMHATDWERVCMGKLEGLPVIVVPTGFMSISNRLRMVLVEEPHSTLEFMLLLTMITLHWHWHLHLAMTYQSVRSHHKQRPPTDDLRPNDTIPNPLTVPRRLHL